LAGREKKEEKERNWSSEKPHGPRSVCLAILGVGFNVSSSRNVNYRYPAMSLPAAALGCISAAANPCCKRAWINYLDYLCHVNH
jgi:hypothetical protein